MNRDAGRTEEAMDVIAQTARLAALSANPAVHAWNILEAPLASNGGPSSISLRVQVVRQLPRLFPQQQQHRDVIERLRRLIPGTTVPALVHAYIECLLQLRVQDEDRERQWNAVETWILHCGDAAFSALQQCTMKTFLRGSHGYADPVTLRWMIWFSKRVLYLLHFLDWQKANAGGGGGGRAYTFLSAILRNVDVVPEEFTEKVLLAWNGLPHSSLTTFRPSWAEETQVSRHLIDLVVSDANSEYQWLVRLLCDCYKDPDRCCDVFLEVLGGHYSRKSVSDAILESTIAEQQISAELIITLIAALLMRSLPQLSPQQIHVLMKIANEIALRLQALSLSVPQNSIVFRLLPPLLLMQSLGLGSPNTAREGEREEASSDDSSQNSSTDHISLVLTHIDEHIRSSSPLNRPFDAATAFGFASKQDLPETAAHAISSLHAEFQDGDYFGFLKMVEALFCSKETTRKHLDDLLLHPVLDRQPAYMLPILFYLLDIHNSPRLTLHIVHSVLPAFVRRTTALLATSDATMYLTKVVRIYQYLIDHGKTIVAASALRGLFELWKVQKKVWPYLLNYLNGWIRKFRNVELMEMELSVLQTIWDICKYYPLDHGYDLLPLLSLLLKSKELPQISLLYALDSIIWLVHEDVLHPIAAWRVLLKPIVTKYGEVPVIQQYMCRYYGLVAEKAEDTEVYQSFKEDVLIHRLLPLTAVIGDTPETPIQVVPGSTLQLAALTALGKYPAYDLLPHIDDPRTFIENHMNTVNLTPVLSALLHHEIKHMRRSVFKGTGVMVGADTKKVDATNTTDALLTRGWGDLCSYMASLWDTESARLAAISPAIRGVVSLSTLFCSQEILTSLRHRQASVVRNGDLEESLYQRMLDTCLLDISIKDDDLLVMLDMSISPWVSFFSAFLEPLLRNRIQMWIRAEQEFAYKEEMEERDMVRMAREKVLIAMLEELLLRRFSDTKLPQVRCHLILAATGLVLAIKKLGIPQSTFYALRMLEILETSYLATSTTFVEFDEIKSSPEIQFAIHISLQRLAAVIVGTEEKHARRVVQILLESAGWLSVNDVGYDDSVLLACGFGLGRIVDYAEDSSNVYNMLQHWFSLDQMGRVDEVAAPLFSSGIMFGISLGIAVTMEEGRNFGSTKKMHASKKQAIAAARNLLLEFAEMVSGESKQMQTSGTHADLVCASIWITVHFEEEHTNKVLEGLNVITASLGQRNTDAVRICATAQTAVAYLRRRMLVSSNAHVQDYHVFATGFTNSSSAEDRCLNLLSMGVSMGVELTLTDDVNLEVLTACKYLAEPALLASLKILSDLCSFQGEDRRVDSRVLKRASFVWSKLLTGWIRNEFPSQSGVRSGEEEEEDTLDVMGRGEPNAEKMVNEREPADFRRLPASDSFVRAIYDVLSTLSASPLKDDQVDAVCSLLESLAVASPTLPIVDWSRIMMGLVPPASFTKTSVRLRGAVLNFALQHASTSKSISRYLLQVFPNAAQAYNFQQQPEEENDAAQNLLGMLVVRGLPVFAGLTSTGHIGASKWAEILQVLYKVLFSVSPVNANKSLQELQRLFLETLVSTCLSSQPGRSVSPLAAARQQIASQVLATLPLGFEGNLAHMEALVFLCCSIQHSDNPQSVSVGHILEIKDKHVLIMYAHVRLTRDPQIAKSYLPRIVRYVRLDGETATTRINAKFVEAFHGCLTVETEAKGVMDLLDVLMATDVPTEMKLIWMEWVVGPYCMACYRRQQSYQERDEEDEAAVSLAESDEFAPFGYVWNLLVRLWAKTEDGVQIAKRLVVLAKTRDFSIPHFVRVALALCGGPSERVADASEWTHWMSCNLEDEDLDGDPLGEPSNSGGSSNSSSSNSVNDRNADQASTRIASQEDLGRAASIASTEQTFA